MIMTRFFYTLLTYAMLPFALLHLLWRSLRQPAYLKYIPERFGFYEEAPFHSVIWLHAVSVGETRAAEPLITRVELVGGEFIYAITADTARGGFELCPADACAIEQAPGAGLFALRAGFAHPVIGRYLEFARDQGIEIAGFEFIETEDGRLVTYDVNTTTNYNAGIEAAAPRPALAAVAGFLGGLLARQNGKGAR